MTRACGVASPWLLLALAWQVSGAWAQTPATAPSPDTQGQIEELKHALVVRDQVIRNLIGRIEQLERTVNGAGAITPAPAVAVTQSYSDAGETVGAATTVPVAAGTRVSDTAARPEASNPGAASLASGSGGASASSLAPANDQQLIRAAFERTLIDRGGLLLPEWTFELAPSFSYAHSSSESLVIDGFTIFPVLIVGDIFSQRLRRNTVTAALTARLGLPWKSQVEVRAPYVYEDDSRLTGDGEEITDSDHGVGDLEIAFSRDLPRLFGRNGPQFLGSLRWKMVTAKDPFGLGKGELPFGTGFQTLSASLTAVSVLDPVVFFGTLSYTDALAARKGENRIDPGDSIDLQLGLALALNLETSVNVTFEQSFTDRTRLNGDEVPGTYVNNGTLSIGMTRSFPSGRSLDTALTIGLSQDSPDLQLGFSMPFRWSHDTGQ
ncbi:MAG TPA: hypothetical protein VH542_09525 [Steroidobacteraceae bacterium]|jgi:hypothetical protein